MAIRIRDPTFSRIIGLRDFGLGLYILALDLVLISFRVWADALKLYLIFRLNFWVWAINVCVYNFG